MYSLNSQNMKPCKTPIRAPDAPSCTGCKCYRKHSTKISQFKFKI